MCFCHSLYCHSVYHRLLHTLVGRRFSNPFSCAAVGNFYVNHWMLGMRIGSTFHTTEQLCNYLLPHIDCGIYTFTLYPTTIPHHALPHSIMPLLFCFLYIQYAIQIFQFEKLPTILSLHFYF